MIDYDTYRRIHYLHRAEGLNVAQIARSLAMDPRTVREWLDEPTFRPRKKAPRPSKLDPYKPVIRQWLERHPYSGTQIFQRLRQNGYEGGIGIVRQYVRCVRPRKAPAFLTLHFEPGECAQVDWGQYGSVNVGNTRRQLNFFVTRRAGVEAGVGYVKKNLLAGLEIADFSLLNPIARQWLDEVANVRVHGETRRRPVDLFEEERHRLQPLPEAVHDFGNVHGVRASNRFRVTFETNRYSVPAEYASRRLTLKASIHAHTKRAGREGGPKNVSHFSFWW